MYLASRPLSRMGRISRSRGEEVILLAHGIDLLMPLRLATSIALDMGAYLLVNILLDDGGKGINLVVDLDLQPCAKRSRHNTENKQGIFGTKHLGNPGKKREYRPAHGDAAEKYRAFLADEPHGGNEIKAHCFDNRIKNGNRLKDDIAAIAGQKHELNLARDKGQRQKQHKGDEPHGLAQRIFRITLVYLTHKQRTNARKRKGKTERHVRHLHGKGQWIEEQERADHETDEKQRMDVSLDLDTAALESAALMNSPKS